MLQMYKLLKNVTEMYNYLNVHSNIRFECVSVRDVQLWWDIQFSSLESQPELGTQ